MNKYFITGLLLIVLVILINACSTEDYGNYGSLTIEKGTFQDPRDGKTYETVKINNQVWMAENLDYSTSDGSWCYDDDLSNCETYGRLYNWNTAMDICPEGWHLPTDREWGDLEISLGMDSNSAYNGQIVRGTDQGLKLKAEWSWVNRFDGNDGNGTNESQFSGLATGRRDHIIMANGDEIIGFVQMGSITHFWTSTQVDNVDAWQRVLDSEWDGSYRGGNPKTGAVSVRCLKD